VTLMTNKGIITKNYVPHTALTVWAENGMYKSRSQADMRSDMCDPAKNDHYDYWYDKAGGWSYTNLTCVELGPRDRAMKTPTTVYVPTFVDEDYIWTKVGDKAVAGSCTDTQCLVLGKCPGDSTQNYTNETVNDNGQCLCKCSTNRKQFATGVEHLIIVFTHLPRWPESVAEEVKSHGVDPAPGNLKVIKMATIVRDRDKKEFRRFAPGEEIRLSVADALLLGGRYSLEDHSHDFTFQNHLLDQDLPAEYKDKLKLHPHLRVTGLSVEIKISYFNPGATGHVSDDLAKDPICYIDVHIIPKWVSNPIRDYFQSNQAGEDEMRSRYYQGILVTFSASGSYAFFDDVKFMFSLASFIVYLTVPNMIMVFLTKFGLGTLSEIYYEAQCTLLNTWELFSGQVCRALVGMVVFHKMSKKGRHSAPHGSVTSSAPSQTPALTPAAPKEKAESAFTEIRSSSSRWSAKRSKKQVLENQNTLNLDILNTELLELFECHECLDPGEIDTLQRVLVKILEDGQPITQHSFVQAVVNGDIGSLHCWANLFDHDRTPWFLERIFDTQRNSRRQFHCESLRTPVGQSDAAVVVCHASSGPAESSETQAPNKDEGDTPKKDAGEGVELPIGRPQGAKVYEGSKVWKVL